MKAGFYPHLAWDAMRKNKRLYCPYILAGGVMVMMEYILGFLTEAPALAEMPGGSVLMTLLPMGCAVIAVFSLLFLFYTHSFLLKQRNRELGLYSILGMDKRNIGKMMAWETAFTALIAMAAGLAAGIGLSKAAELALLKLLDMESTFRLSVGLRSLRNTLLIFAGIYGLLLLNSLRKLRRSQPLELMQSSRVGEKIPKYTWVTALLGIVMLGVAYYLAVRIEEPVTALFVFFAAVILVIIGTYLLFISASVAFCRLLQKNKNYYYHPKHFVSLSSMVYRMKRNGAGLASICILLTMVLVMISSSASLYFGAEDAIQNRYPKGVNIETSYKEIEGISDENILELRSAVADLSGTDSPLTGVRTCELSGLFTDEGIIIDVGSAENFSLMSYDRVGYFYVLSIDDYNAMMGENKTLAEDECLIYCDRLNIQWRSFDVEYGRCYRVIERLGAFEQDKDSVVMTMPSVFMVVDNLNDFAQPLRDIKNGNGDLLVRYVWNVGFDVKTSADEVEIRNRIYDYLRSRILESDGAMFYVQSREMQRSSFFEMYGSLFFLGVMLSIVFLLAAVLIVYYKQISEGYEDRSRFEIMRKIGMTKKNIRASINSQMLTVFFMPLFAAGIHLAFAYPYISKIMLMFAFDNTALNIAINLICFAAFGLLYAIVYKITSGAYYAIVSGGKD